MMASNSASAQLATDNLDVFRDVADEPQAVPTTPPRSWRRVLVCFVLGLAIGWLVIGWWLWPVEWTNSAPWQLSIAYQKQYVALVAERLWQTANVSEARSTLAGWPSADLSQLLAAMQRETPSPITRQHLSNLAQSLRLSGSGRVQATGLLGQPVLALGIAVALLPLLGAVGLVLTPRLRLRRRARAASVVAAPGDTAAMAPEDAMVGGRQSVEGATTEQGETVQTAAQPGSPQNSDAAAGPATPAVNSEAAGTPGRRPPPAQESPAKQPSGTQQSPAKQPAASQDGPPAKQARPPTPGQPAPDQRPDNQQAAAQPAQTPGSNVAPAQPAAKPPAEDPQDEKPAALSELLSLFETEDDGQGALEALDAKLVQIDGSELRARCVDVMRKLHERRVLAASEPAEQPA